MTFTVSSPDFSEDGAIPRRHTCDGEDVSPALSWEGAPDDTLSLALILDDPDARGFAHWVLFDVAPGATGALPAGYSASPDAPPQGNERLRAPRLRRPVPAVRQPPLRVHPLRARCGARAAWFAPRRRGQAGDAWPCPRRGTAHGVVSAQLDPIGSCQARAAQLGSKSTAVAPDAPDQARAPCACSGRGRSSGSCRRLACGRSGRR